MGEWIVSLEGTQAGVRVAFVLALCSAFFHASFGALQKSRFDPWLTRGAIDAWLVLLSAPIALFLVPWPSGNLWWVMLGVVIIHFIYKVFVALAYERAPYTVVYPIMRGTGPVFIVAAASVFFDETYTPLQWGGVACLSAGMFALSARNLQTEKLDRRGLKIALIFASIGGLSVAAYTVYDAWGIRQAPDPFTFLAWFFFLSSIDMPLLTAHRLRKIDRASLKPLMWRSLIGALIAWLSFGGVMLATRLDKVGQAAVLRETSPVFAALLGWLVLRETVGIQRFLFMSLIALGAVIMEIGRV